MLNQNKGFVYAFGSINENADAFKIHSVISYSISKYEHRVSCRNMPQKYKMALFSSFAGQIWPYLPFSKHSYTTCGFGGHIEFF